MLKASLSPHCITALLPDSGHTRLPLPVGISQKQNYGEANLLCLSMVHSIMRQLHSIFLVPLMAGVWVVSCLGGFQFGLL